MTLDIRAWKPKQQLARSRRPHSVSALENDRDRFAVHSSVLFASLFAGAALLYSFVLYRYQVQWQRGIKADLWYQPGDIWMTVDAGRFVWHGALGYVYQGAGQSYALPLSYILAAPIAAIVDHFHLVEPLLPIIRASGWPVAAAFILIFNIFVLDAVRRLAWDVGIRQHLWATQAMTVLVVCVPAFQFGHFEDVLALTFLIHGIRYFLAGRPLACSFLLALAISSKQWAVLAVPLVIVLTPRGRRLLATAVAASLPVLFTGIVLMTDAKHGLTALFSPASPKRTDPGHLSFFYTWFGDKTSRATRTASVLVSPIVACLFRRIRRVPAILGALSVLLLLRPLFEPLVYSYYWMPAFLFAGMVGVAAHNRVRVRDWVWQVAAIVWALPHGNPASTGLWWAVEAPFIALIWMQVASNCGFSLRSPISKPSDNRSASLGSPDENGAAERPLLTVGH